MCVCGKKNIGLFRESERKHRFLIDEPILKIEDISMDICDCLCTSLVQMKF